MSTTVEYILDVETQKAQTGLKKTEQQTKKTTSAIKDSRKAARGMSGSFQAVGEVANLVNPQLAGLADVAIGASSAFRAFGRSLASGNPIIISITLALTGLIGIYTAYNASVRRNEASQKALQKATATANQEIEKSIEVFDRAENTLLSSAERVNKLAFEYQKLTGQISASEAAEIQREQKTAKFRDEATKQIEIQRRALFEQKRDLQRIKDANRERFDLLIREGRALDENGNKLEEFAKVSQRIFDTNKEIESIVDRSQKLRTEGQERINAQAKQYQDTLKGIADETERQKQREEAIKRAKERQTQLQGLLNDLQMQSATLAAKVRDSEIARMAPLMQINAQYQKEIDSLNGIEAGIIKQFEEAERVARSKKDQVLLTEIQQAKTEALARVEQARGDAEEVRASKLGKIYAKNTKTQLKGLANIGKAFGQTLAKQIQAQNQVGKIIDQANSDQLTALDKINQAEQERLKVLQEIAKQQKINTDEAQKAVEARAERERARVRQQQAAGVVGGVETIIKAAIDPSALIGAIGAQFGIVGSAIAGVATTLADLGRVDPQQAKDLAEELGISQKRAEEMIREQRTEEIKENFRATFEGIAKGLEVVVPLIFEMLPPILFDAAKMIINALIQLPVFIASHLAKAIGNVLKGVVEFFKNPIKNIFEALKQAFTNLVDLIVGAFTSVFPSFMGGGRMPSAQGGIRFTGASRGLAMLHEGEAIIPRSGQISSSVARDAQNIMQAQGGGGVTVVINSAITERSAVDALVRKIEERFSSFGQSTSPLFGGR